VIELIGEENFKMNPKHMEEVMDVLRKESILEESDDNKSAAISASNHITNTSEVKKNV
jgi:hypothetical protein